VNLIVANGVAALAAKAATKTIPIVFASGFDPVRDGLVESLAKPGGNVTGVVFFSSIAGSKRLDLLRQLVPKASTIAVLVNIASSATAAELKDIQTAAQELGQRVIVYTIIDERDLDLAFKDFERTGAGALLVGAGTFLNSNRKGIVRLAARHALPAMYGLREFAIDGGLFSYGASTLEAYTQAGVYTGRILKGEKPGEMAVMQSTKVEFVVNLRAARALDFEVSPLILARADEVIE
jgi:putative ABC transport system substrate-binding protein